MWEREINLIDSLGKLYPKFGNKFDDVEYKDFPRDNCNRAWWVYDLCRYHLNRRLPQLEEFIRGNNKTTWRWYKYEFNITNEQCGKKS